MLRLPLAELDHGHGIDHLACVYLPPLDPLAHPREVDSLIYLMGRLRGPGGCPWDREQSHESLKRYLLEETYEVLEAHRLRRSRRSMAEELGDLLLQIVFHAQVAVSDEEFTLGDVVQAIVTKLVRRHPHVFGDVEVENAEGVPRNWQTIKSAEAGASARRARATFAEEDLEVTGLLRSMPRSLPALDDTHQISERAAKAGFEWDRMEDVFAKVHEELEELRTAATRRIGQEELGDLLFTLVNVARWWGVDAEETLRAAEPQVHPPLRGDGAPGRDRRQAPARDSRGGDGTVLAGGQASRAGLMEIAPQATGGQARRLTRGLALLMR